MVPSQVAERGDEQMDPQSLVPDPHPRLAEVDLQLMARRRLEPNRRPRRRLQLATPTRNTALDMAKAPRAPMFGRQLLAHHVGVAAVPDEPLAQPPVQPVDPKSEETRVGNAVVCKCKLWGSP